MAPCSWQHGGPITLAGDTREKRRRAIAVVVTSNQNFGYNDPTRMPIHDGLLIVRGKPGGHGTVQGLPQRAYSTTRVGSGFEGRHARQTADLKRPRQSD